MAAPAIKARPNSESNQCKNPPSSSPLHIPFAHSSSSTPQSSTLSHPLIGSVSYLEMRFTPSSYNLLLFFL